MRIFVGVAAAALLALPGGAACGVPSYSGPSLRPNAETARPQRDDSDNPPIEKSRDAFGRTVRVQTFRRPAVVMDLAPLSIARRKVFERSYGVLPDREIALEMKCAADETGRVMLWLCGIESPVDGDGFKPNLLSGLVAAVPVDLPVIPAIAPKKAEGLTRWVTFTVRILPSAVPDAEPTAGPLVDKAEIVGLEAARSSVDYPSNALRHEAGGRMVALCVVQADLSVSCALESFHPAENASYFAEVAPSLFLRGRVGAKLANGRPAAGARFNIAVNFAIPR